MRSKLRNLLRPILRKYPLVWRSLVQADSQVERWLIGTSQKLPILIRPELRQIHIAITAYCNLRCEGCLYGRGFMANHQLDWPVVRDLIDDAKALDAWNLRFYGGEPLLHPDLPKMVAHASGQGLDSHVTTNGVLLEEKFDELFDAGVRHLTLGYYGTGEKYDQYVNRPGRYARMEAGIAYVRERYGEDVSIKINWLLMRPSCNKGDLMAAWDFARRYDLKMQIDLVHYSLPYFTEGPDQELQFRPEDREAIEALVADLISLKNEHPEVIQHELPGLRSIPDWLVRKPGMRVPCNANQMLWVGADGTVQLCYVLFELGNLHDRRLRDMLFGPSHRQAARDAVALNCPDCRCGYDVRVLNHGPSRATYSENHNAHHP